MAENDIQIEDIFATDKTDEIRAALTDLMKKYGLHTHDGRNSLEIDILANARKIRLASLNRISDKSDGNVDITGATTLDRDYFYDHLTVKSTGVLTTASYRIFADIIEIDGGGVIKNDGNNGGNGQNGNNGTGGYGLPLGGTAGSAIASGSLPADEDGKVGGDGGSGNTYGSGYGTSNPGTAGDSVAKSLGSAGSGGAGGGAAYGSDNGGSGGAGGSQTGTVFNIPRSFISAYQLIDNQPSLTNLLGSAGSGSGGSGQGGLGYGGSGAWGGAGGGSGSTGGFVCIFAKQIINNGTIEAKGGNGGNGGAGGGPTPGNAQYPGKGSGGGGGGAGGSGGVIILVYGDLSGGGAVVVTGGAGGTGGIGGASAQGETYRGYSGGNGTAGLSGQTFSIQISSL